MFLTLFRKECVQYLKSVVYYIFLIYLVVDFVMQMGTFEIVNEPKPNQESYMEYGSVQTKDSSVIMQITLENLLYEYDINEYTTYPIGFYKKVILNEEEQQQIQDIILDMTGLTKQEFENTYKEYNESVNKAMEHAVDTGEVMNWESLPEPAFSVREGYEYETFQKDMETVDSLLGGGSKYNEHNILENAEESPTYEQACKVYDDFIIKDKITNAYARLFCDYEGITLAIVTVFLAVARALRDRRAQVEQVVYAHKISSVKIILSRYLAGVIMVVVPVCLLSCSTLIQAVYYAKRIHAEYDLFAFVKYIGFWLLPTILVTLSVGFFLTELTDSAIAILVQGIWWFVSVFMATDLVGVTGWNLIPRFNSLVGYEIYEQMKDQLFRNRWFYTALAMILLLLTIWIYDGKRKGVFVSVGARIRNCKNKLEA